MSARSTPLLAAIGLTLLATIPLVAANGHGNGNGNGNVGSFNGNGNAGNNNGNGNLGDNNGNANTGNDDGNNNAGNDNGNDNAADSQGNGNHGDGSGNGSQGTDQDLTAPGRSGRVLPLKDHRHYDLRWLLHIGFDQPEHLLVHCSLVSGQCWRQVVLRP